MKKECNCDCIWCERGGHTSCGLDCPFSGQLGCNHVVITDAVESTRKQEREFWKKDKELALKSTLDKIWSMKFREIENHEDMNNYNNKKLGFYTAIKQAKSALESLLNSPNINK